MRSFSPRRIARLGAAVVAATLCLAPAAGATPSFRVPHEPASMEDYLEMVIQEVDAFWTEVYAAAGVGQPQVRFLWMAPGESVPNGCTQSTDDTAAMYCPKDDTIYVSQALGDAIAKGHGDFGLAVVIAHEYAHNVQQETGVFQKRRRTDMPTELQADCMAGQWASWETLRGNLESDDLAEGAGAFYKLGDYDVDARDHHGTPRQRKRAFLRGYAKGRCTRYLRNLG